MMLTWVSLFTFPACAGLSALLVGTIHRREQLEDGALLRQFMIFLIVGMALAYTILQRPNVQRRLSPELQQQADVDADPINKALEHIGPQYAAQYRAALAREVTAGATLPEARLQTRSMLTAFVTAQLGFVGQDMHVAWGRLTVDSLRELEARGSEECYAAVSGQALDRDTLARGFSAKNTADFQSIVAQALLDSPGLQVPGQAPRHVSADTDRPADFNATMLEYNGIQETVAKRYGAEAAALLTSKRFPQSPPLSADTICDARIYQIESMLERPKATAALLIDSALR